MIIPILFTTFDEKKMKIKTGIGYDVHQLKEGLPLRIGGVDIPHNLGALGHSDADVLLHAICDALFGAAGLRDIGFHFPDTKAEYKGINSLLLLEETVRIIKDSGYEISNIDSTVVLQKPKIGLYIPSMVEAISAASGVNVQDINVKATTTEYLGFAGREEGIAAYAIATLIKP